MVTRFMKRAVFFLMAVMLLVPVLVGCNQQAQAPGETPAAASTPTPKPEPTETPLPAKMEGDEFDNGAIGRNGGVSSCSPISSQVGIDILKAGGNAVDAAVATIFTAGIVEPNLSGVGGCGMMNIYLKETGEYIILEYMETVPSAVTPGWFNPETDKIGAKNVAVPSQVHGLLTALEKYGTMTRQAVMAPAIKIAREGWVLDARLAGALKGSFDMLSVHPTASGIYLNDGLPYEAGATIKNEPLADTLQRISDGGIEEFYKGELAKQLVETMQKDGSLITLEDLAAYETAQREPLRTTYHGYEVVVPPPPSNGGDWLLELLNIIENYDLKSMGVNTPEYLFVFNEASRLGLSDSYAFIGDPAFYNLPMEQMTSKEYAKERGKLIQADKVLPTAPAGDLPVEKLNPTGEESQHTSHTAVIDSFGNIVSATNTLGLGWGAQYSPEGLGFFMNSHISNLEHRPEMSDSPDFVAPGKRVRSTITPTLVLQDGEPIMAIGSPGSLAIPPAVAMIINNVLLFDMNIQQAINLPRAMAIDRNGPTLTVEADRFDAAVIAKLEEYGYTINNVGEYNMAVGGVAAIHLDREAGIFYAGADPRRTYKALAY